MNIEKENQQLIRNNQVDQERLKQQKKKIKEQRQELKAEKAKLKVCLHVIICPTYKLYLLKLLQIYVCMYLDTTAARVCMYLCVHA